MNTSTTTKETVFATEKPNRQQRRAALKMNHRNRVRQVIKFVNTDGLEDEKVIFHVKKSNLPRLYPNMSRIK